MTAWQIGRWGLQCLCLVGMLGILGSCSAGGDEGCGGIENVVSCVDVTSVIPTITGGSDTSNVDALQDLCRDLNGVVTSVESFTDHQARVTFRNSQFRTASSSFDARIVGYTVVYRLNRCPNNAVGCPPLTGFTVTGNTLLVPRDTEVSTTLPLVPLRVKDEYVSRGGELGVAAPSYTATYTFTAQTIRFNDGFTITASTEFSITNFNNCGQ